MAQAWRSAAAICKSSACALPNSIFKTLARRPILSSARPIPYPASRHASVLGSVESMLPLHSKVAIARLKSNIGSDTAFWSWLSQGMKNPDLNSSGSSSPSSFSSHDICTPGITRSFPSKNCLQILK